MAHHHIEKTLKQENVNPNCIKATEHIGWHYLFVRASQIEDELRKVRDFLVHKTFLFNFLI